MKGEKYFMINNELKISGGGKNEHYEVISFVRGFSIFTIVLMHLLQGYIKSCPSIVAKAAAIGGPGVHVFFFCSGFGLYLSYLRKPIGFVDFMKKRLLKIYVPYIIIILISAFVPFMFNGNRIQAFLSHLFLYKMFIPEYESSFGNQFWFISTLIQLYIVFIPLCKVKKKLGKKFFLITFSISVAWWIFTGITGLCNERIWGSFFLQYLWEFALGMMIAQRLEEGESIEYNRKSLFLIAVIGITIAAIASLKGGVLNTFNDLFAMSGYLSLSLFIYLFEYNWIRKLFLFISSISYELYLVHVLVFKIIFTIIPTSGKVEYLIAVFAFVLAVMIAYIYSIFINKIMKNKKKIICG